MTGLVCIFDEWFYVVDHNMGGSGIIRPPSQEVVIMQHEKLLASMRKCSIANNYDGLSELEDYVQESPHQAGKIAWEILNSIGDPGHDDHALCVNLAKICLLGWGGRYFEDLVLESWQTLSPEIQENIVNGFGEMDFGMATVVEIYLESNDVAIQHRILSVIAISRAEEFRGQLPKMLDVVGRYSDLSKQAGLDRLLNGLRGQCE